MAARNYAATLDAVVKSVTPATHTKTCKVLGDGRGNFSCVELAAGEVYTLRSELSSVSAGISGASLVGIEDAAALYTGASVEAALAERVTGLRVDDVVDDRTVGGVEVVHVIDIVDGVTADKDITLTHKTEVLSVEVIKKAGAGGAGDLITVKNAATAITDAMDINVADKAVVRASTIDDAASVISAGGTLRVTKTKVAVANVACRVIVRGIRRA